MNARHADVDRRPEVWLGLDVGTQSARALAVTANGEVVGAGTRPLTSERSGPRHEQDPETWWRAIAAASSEAMQTVSAQAVRGVAVDATSGTILLVDRKGSPLTPGLMYDDTRATARRSSQRGGRAVWAELGYCRMQPSWALPKLLWLLEAYPLLPRGARLAHQSDFINRRLVGHEVPADLSNALKSGAHLVEERWPRRSWTSSACRRSAAGAGPFGDGHRGGRRAAATATGIPAGTPVIAGMTDGCAAQLGAGALRPGRWNSVLGTTLVVKGVTHELIHDPLGVVYSHRAPNGDWLPGGASSTGCGPDLPGLRRSRSRRAGRAASAHEPAAMLAYPLASAGERFPFVAPAARVRARRRRLRSGPVRGRPAGRRLRRAAVLRLPRSPGRPDRRRPRSSPAAPRGTTTGASSAPTSSGARSRFPRTRNPRSGWPFWRPARAEIPPTLPPRWCASE
jgi:sugar (pentulose or hexulose) kinase